MNSTIIRDNLVDLAEPVEAIVNSSNPFMSSGGGVCGAIHKAAGFEFTRYCISLGGLVTHWLQCIRKVVILKNSL